MWELQLVGVSSSCFVHTWKGESCLETSRGSSEILKQYYMRSLGRSFWDFFWHIPHEDFEIFCMLAWGTWWEQNWLLHGGLSRDVHTQVSFVENYLMEFPSYHGINNIRVPKTTSLVDGRSRKLGHWRWTLMWLSVKGLTQWVLG